MKDRWSIGIDLGQTNVKMLCFRRGEAGYRLMGHGFFKRNDTQRLKEAFQVREVRSGRIRINIEDPSIKIRRIEVPEVPEGELPEVIKWGMKGVVDGSVEDYLFRYRMLPKAPGSLSPAERFFLVYAVRKEAVQKQMGLLKGLGIPSPEVLEPNAAALFLSLHHNYNLEPTDRIVLIDLGSSSPLFTVMSGDGLLFSRPLGPLSGESLTKQISRDLGIGENEAEELKLSADIKIKNTMAHFFSRAVVEIQRSIDSYLLQFGGQRITRILLTGGGAAISGFLLHVSTTLKIETGLLEPFRSIDNSRNGKESLKPEENYYGLACGLALE